MKILVGSTGFVGGNILAVENFDGAYHRADIQTAYGSKPDLLVYAGVPAVKFIANKNPQADMDYIYEAQKNISKIAPKQIVLISTIDVLKNPVFVDEDAVVNTEGLTAYGLNRYKLELWVREHYPEALIVRLPGLFGMNLKKNFIYDILHPIPSMLAADKFIRFAKQEPLLKKHYLLQENGFYKLRQSVNNVAMKELYHSFQRLKFFATQFTDSRNEYQFYPLQRLWQDINAALQSGVKLLHLATEPLSAAEIYSYVEGKEFTNHCINTPMAYDYYTKYAELLGGSGHYIMKRKDVLYEIKKYIDEEREK